MNRMLLERFSGGQGRKKRREPFVYGVKFKDGGNDFVYERTGGVADYGQNDVVPEELLTVHNKLKRCVVGNDGAFKYYLNPDNSMNKEGVDPSPWGFVSSITHDYGEAYPAGDGVVKGVSRIMVDGSVQDAEQIIGCVVELRDTPGTRFWYAMIVGFEELTQTIVVSHPHINGFGLDAWGDQCDWYRIGSAKLGGQDGQVMVEIPRFYHRWKMYEEGGDVWQEHQISLEEFAGSKMYEKRYISAFEGVAADKDISDNYVPHDGWKGTWDEVNAVWGAVAAESTGILKGILSVPGYYPRTNLARGDTTHTFRDYCKIGSDYHQYDFASNWILQLLILTEYADFNSQNRVAAGITGVNSTRWNEYNGRRAMRKTGDTIRAGNHTWDMHGLNNEMPISKVGESVSNYRIESMSYRGVENVWGHLWKWVDGINLYFYEDVSTPGPAEGDIRYAKPSICEDPDLFNDAAPPLTGYTEYEDKLINHIYESEAWVQKTRFWIIPSARLLPDGAGGSGSANTYMGDYYYTSSVSAAGTMRAVLVGGLARNNVFAGAWCVASYYASTNSYVSVGGRLCKKIIL